MSAAPDDDSGLEKGVDDLLGLELDGVEAVVAEDSQFLTLDFSPNKESVHRWRKLPDCDEFVGPRRSKHTSVAYKGAIYVFGGDNGKQMLNDMIRFDLNDLSWGRAFTMGTLPTPRYHHSAVVHGSSMYVFGGYAGDILNNSNLHNRNDLFEYKFSTGQWSQVRVEDPLPPARSAHAASVAEEHMWIFGGFDGHKRLNDMWRLSLAAGPLRHFRRWERVSQEGDVPPICCNFSSCVCEGAWYVFSGQTGAKGFNDLYEFSFGTRRWRRLSTEYVLRAAVAPPARRYGHSMVEHNRRLYVLGGTADDSHEATLHVYDLHSQTWTEIGLQVGTRPSTRVFHTAVTICDAMYVFGGMMEKDGEKGRSSEIFRFQFSSYPRCTLHEDLGRMLESRQLCDLRFLVGKDRVPIYAHIPIVAARSTHLRNLIKQSREASGGVEAVPDPAAPSAASPAAPVAFAQQQPDIPVLDVSIPDAEPFAFEMILAYIYTDKIDPTQRGQDPNSNGVVLLIMEVYRLAMAFSMKRLECLSIKYLESMIKTQNVLVALSSASRLGLSYIKEYCFRLIVKEANYNQIVMSKELETLEQPLMVELVRRRQTFRTGPEPPGVEVIGQSLEEDLRAFLEDGVGNDFCDITLVANTVSIPAHKMILSSRSAYFEAMFRNWARAAEAVEIQLGDVVPSGKAFRSLLRYIYFGAVDMPPEDSLFLFAAPPFYGFSNNRLQVFCKENLETNISTENVLEILEAAHKIQANEMKRHSLSKIVANFSSVAKNQVIFTSLMQKEKLGQLDKALLLDIIEAVAEGGKECLPITASPASARSAHLPSTASFSDSS